MTTEKLRMTTEKLRMTTEKLRITIGTLRTIIGTIHNDYIYEQIPRRYISRHPGCAAGAETIRHYSQPCP